MDGGEEDGAAFATQVNETNNRLVKERKLSVSVGERESMPGQVTKQRRTGMGRIGQRRQGFGSGSEEEQMGHDKTHSDLEEGFFTFGLFRR